MLNKIRYFLRNGTWPHEEGEPATDSRLVRVAKIVMYTIKGLTEHSVGVRAAALTFFTLMSIVPVAALIFGIVKGFGLQENLTAFLYEKFADYSIIIDYLLYFADNMLVRAKGGVVAAAGFILLIWSVVQVFGNIENAFNNIWEVKKRRSIARKITDYVTVVVIAPLLWLVSNNLLSALRKSVESFSGSLVAEILFGLISFIAIWLMFAFIYFMMPNTKVKFKGALAAGVIAGTIFQLFQMGYFLLQAYLNKYNVIYGSFAAVPLFLIWLQWSWMILLVGAELSFAYQNIGAYEMERESTNMCYDRRRKVMLAAMLAIVRHFRKGLGPASATTVAEEISMPVRIVRDVLYDLEQAGLVAVVRNDRDEMVHRYTPAVDIHSLTVADVMEKVECTTRISGHIPFEGNPLLDKASGAVDGMKEENRTSPRNVPLTDLLDE